MKSDVGGSPSVGARRHPAANPRMGPVPGELHRVRTLGDRQEPAAGIPGPVGHRRRHVRFRAVSLEDLGAHLRSGLVRDVQDRTPPRRCERSIRVADAVARRDGTPPAVGLTSVKSLEKWALED